jgi:hypothetical protein
MRFECRPIVKGMAGYGIALDVTDAALVPRVKPEGKLLPLVRARYGAQACGRKPPIAREGVQTLVETDFAGGCIMMLHQRPRIVEQHLSRHFAKPPERALHAVEPGRLPLVPEGSHNRPPRIAQCRHKQMHPHRGAADRHRGCPEIDLQLLARRRLKPQAGPRLGPQRLAHWRHCALRCAQRHRDAVLAQQVLTHHIAIAAMPSKALCQPLLQAVEPPLAARLTKRHPAARRKVPLRASCGKAAHARARDGTSTRWSSGSPVLRPRSVTDLLSPG